MQRLLLGGWVLSTVVLAGAQSVSPTTGAEKRCMTNCIYLNMSADAILIEPRLKALTKGVSREEAYNRSSREEIIEALNGFVDKYADSHVKGLFLNINYQRACFDSKVMESYWNLEDPEKEIRGWPRMFWAVKKKGIDTYDVCIKRCRKDGISPWISFRMNDHHYFDTPSSINRLWLDHPELRTNPPHGLFNYAKKEVRDYYKAFIKEVLDTYDVDGIELDWMRTQTIFPGGKEAEGMPLIDQYMREIREMTETKAKERGHPIHIAARVPVTPEIGKHFGLDAVTWAQEDLIDILVLSNWFVPTNFDIPVERWKEDIGPKSSTIIAAGADFAYCACRGEHVKQLGGNIETMRGFAVSEYSRGADAVYIFNNFMIPYKLKQIGPDGKVSYTNDKHEAMRQLGELPAMLGKPRTHVLTYHAPDLTGPPKGPYALAPGETKEFQIHIGPKPKQGSCQVNIGLELMEGVDTATFAVKVNGASCDSLGDMPRDPRYKYDNSKIWHVVKHVSETGARVVQFNAALGALKDGYNTVSVTNTSATGQALTWLEMHLE